MSLDARTIVQNTSGATRSFGFLPPHGVELEDDETYEVVGDIFSRLRNERDRAALEAALVNGDLTIVKTAANIAEDETAGNSKALDVDSGSVVARDVDYEEAGSSA